MRLNAPRAHPERWLWLRGLAALLSPSGGRAKLSTLIYHRVLPETDPLFPNEVDAASFDRQMGMLAENFNVLSLSDAVARLRRGALPERALCVTFDDGYADNHNIALPILQRRRIAATFFVATGFLNGGRMWNDAIIEIVRQARGPVLDLTSVGLAGYPVETYPQRHAAAIAIIAALKYSQPEERAERVNRLVQSTATQLPTDLMMSDAQVRGLHQAGMEIGGHTVHHPILARLEDTRARDEIAEGKERLEGIIGDRLRVFAYPNGKPGTDYAPQHVAMVKALGFEAAVSTAWGAAGKDSDPFQLPRFTPWDKTPTRFGLRLLRNMLRRGVPTAGVPGS